MDADGSRVSRGFHATVSGTYRFDFLDRIAAFSESGSVHQTFDQRGQGFDRIVNGIVDFGAFEVRAR